MIRHIRFVIEQQYNSILYDAKNNTYSIEKSNDFLMSGDILILLILLYQSRSLIKEERILIEEKLINLFTLEERRKLKIFFRSYNYHYSPSQRNEIRGKINDLFHAILEQKQILFLYRKNNELKERKVKPLTINFHDYQFYLVAEFVGKEYKTPVNFRIDKIEKITILEERFEINHTNDFFKPGKHSNQSYNMFTGEEVKVKLRVDSSIEEYVYRAFPTAKKINVYKGRYTIFDVKVLGMDGILFWILGQQDRVEVISPEELRNKVKDIIFRMTKIYK